MNHHGEVTRPALDLSLAARARARFLLNGLYTEMFGPEIRVENSRSIRVKIIELEAHLPHVRDHMPKAVYVTMVRQIVNLECVCELLETLA